jgi:hypothetical protein
MQSYPLTFADLYFSTAKEARDLYTLNAIPATAMTSPPTPNTPTVPAPEPSSMAHASGPVRSQRKSVTARMRTGPMSAALKARVLRNTSNRMSKANTTPANTAINPPTEAETTELTSPSSPGPSSSQFPEDVSDDESHTSTHSDLDLAPPVADDMSVDEEVLPTTVAGFSAPCDSTIQVKAVPALGVSVLVQTPPPTLLFVDEDERPAWLLTSIEGLLQHAPYYLCLSKVVDLFLAQEARLSYPAKVSRP